MRFQVRSLALLSGIRIRRGRELWCRPAATALIRLLAWEPPHAVGAALEKAKRQKKKKKAILVTKNQSRAKIWAVFLFSYLYCSSGKCDKLQTGNTAEYICMSQWTAIILTRRWQHALFQYLNLLRNFTLMPKYHLFWNAQTVLK